MFVPTRKTSSQIRNKLRKIGASSSQGFSLLVLLCCFLFALSRLGDEWRVDRSDWFFSPRKYLLFPVGFWERVEADAGGSVVLGTVFEEEPKALGELVLCFFEACSEKLYGVSRSVWAMSDFFAARDRLFLGIIVGTRPLRGASSPSVWAIGGQVHYCIRTFYPSNPTLWRRTLIHLNSSFS